MSGRNWERKRESKAIVSNDNSRLHCLNYTEKQGPISFDVKIDFSFKAHY